MIAIFFPPPVAIMWIEFQSSRMSSLNQRHLFYDIRNICITISEFTRDIDLYQLATAD